MLPMGPCSMQPLAYYLRGHPFILTTPVAGKSSRSTVSQNSTQHQRQSDHSWLLGMTKLQDTISPVSKFWEQWVSQSTLKHGSGIIESLEQAELVTGFLGTFQNRKILLKIWQGEFVLKGVPNMVLVKVICFVNVRN